MRPELVFGMQAGMSVMVAVFSISMLASGRAESVYLPVLTSIVGYWLPAPRYRKPAPAPRAADADAAVADAEQMA